MTGGGAEEAASAAARAADKVFRHRDATGAFLHDVIARMEEPAAGAEPLLAEVLRDGRRLRSDPALAELRERFRAEFARLPERCKALRSPARYEVRISPGLERLQDQVVRQTRERELGG